MSIEERRKTAAAVRAAYFEGAHKGVELGSEQRDPDDRLLADYLRFSRANDHATAFENDRLPDHIPRPY